MYFIEIEKAPPALQAGLSQLMAEYPLAERPAAGLQPVTFRLEETRVGERSFEAVPDGKGGWDVRYGRPIEAFRALGRLLAGPAAEPFGETCQFEMLSLQLECSRNGVLRPDQAKAFARRAALLGVNTLMLYLEDTYEVPGEPFFGYLRGRFTRRELQDLDDYTHALGIEMIPCVQTLGHLEQVLQWKQAYGGVTDTESVLLAGDDKTHALLEKMIDAASAPFRSRRIHLGMDEAWGLGTGKFREKFGERPTFDIMNDHLDTVAAMCEKRGLHPMIWSDMYFRIGSKKGEYYDPEAKIPPEVAKRIPANVELVYWDYYHTDREFYESHIDKHRDFLGKEPVVASGSWNWNHFWTNIPYSLARVVPCVEACLAKGVRQVFMTTWGDDGMECDLYSVLPVIQVFADLAYGHPYDEEASAWRFAATCRADFQDYSLASHLDRPGPGKTIAQDYSNTSKWLMWDDPFLGLCEPFQEVDSYRAGYRELASALEAAAAKENPGASRLRFPAQIAKVLMLKCDLRKNLSAAYGNKDREEVRRLLETEVRPLAAEMETLWKRHRDLWLATYKPFGLEVIEIRYGGQITRLRSLADRLQGWLDGSVETIPELETDLHPYAENQGLAGRYRRIATPSCLF